jgi:hypothetical protein
MDLEMLQHVKTGRVDVQKSTAGVLLSQVVGPSSPLRLNYPRIVPHTHVYFHDEPGNLNFARNPDPWTASVLTEYTRYPASLHDHPSGLSQTHSLYSSNCYYTALPVN